MTLFHTRDKLQARDKFQDAVGKWYFLGNEPIRICMVYSYDDKIYFFDYWGFPHHKWEKFGKFDRFSTTKFYLTNMVDEILAEKYEKGYQCAMVEKINLKSLNHKKGLIFMIKNNKEKKKSEKNI